VKIMLDCSPAKIAEYRERYGADFWQLRTPLTQYKLAGVPYGLENGMFGADPAIALPRWLRMLEVAEAEMWEGDGNRPVFVTLPDILCDAQRTLELFRHFKLRTNEFPRALVLQNGIEHTDIPWDDLAAVFIGGDDNFKYSPEAMRAAKTAKILGKWVHVGRVNTAARARNWLGLADSLDGSGVSRFDHMLEDVLGVIEGDHPQHAMELRA
jgi:hypothetical protein